MLSPLLCRCSFLTRSALAGAGASGELLTTAQWIRHFVYQHEDYKRDSLVSEAITYDLVKVAEGIGNGTVNAPGPVFFFFFLC